MSSPSSREFLELSEACDLEGNRFVLTPRPCPTCGVVAREVLGLRGGEYQRYHQGIVSRIVRCHECGLIYPDPFPLPCDSQKLYSDPDKYFGGDDSENKVESYRGLVREVGERLGGFPFRLLDVGSGRGEILAAARLEGVTAVGLELSQAMIAEADARYNVEVRSQTIEEFSGTIRDAFDAITLCAVLEHVYDPNSMISCAAQLLRPGGILYVDVPNEPNLLTHVGNTWNRLTGSPAVYNIQPTWPPYHVFGFNRRALNVLLSKHGFTLQSVQIHAAPNVPAHSHWKDQARAFVATQINRLANYTGTAANMFVWARLAEGDASDPPGKDQAQQ